MTETIRVIDNAVPLFALRDFYNKITSHMFPWYYAKVVEQGVTEDDEKYNFQFSHTLYNGNVPKDNNFHVVSNLLDFVPDLHALVRFKVNANPRYSEIIEHTYHTDTPFECNTAIIYLNTNNGYTKFITGEKVESVEGRMVIFPSSLLHTGTTCTDKQCRFVANVNYF